MVAISTNNSSYVQYLNQKEDILSLIKFYRKTILPTISIGSREKIMMISNILLLIHFLLWKKTERIPSPQQHSPKSNNP